MKTETDTKAIKAATLSRNWGPFDGSIMASPPVARGDYDCLCPKLPLFKFYWARGAVLLAILIWVGFICWIGLRSGLDVSPVVSDADSMLVPNAESTEPPPAKAARTDEDEWEWIYMPGASNSGSITRKPEVLKICRQTIIVPASFSSVDFVDRSLPPRLPDVPMPLATD